MSKNREPTVIHIDTETIRAQLGYDELFELPSLTISASYAVPVAPAPNGTETNGEASTSNPREGWISGEALVAAQAEEGFPEKYELRWPFRPTQPEDWDGREFVLQTVLNQLGISISSNTSPIVLVPPPCLDLSTSTQALYSQIAFEKLNTPHFAVLPASLAALFALGQTTGVIVHLGRDACTVNVIVDSIFREECSASVRAGRRHCEEHFERLLMDDQALEKELRSVAGKEGDWAQGEKEKYVREIAEFVWSECCEGDDIEVLTATGAKTVLPGKEEEDDSAFDVAKKLVDNGQPPTNTSHKSKKQIAAQQAKASAAAAAAASAAEAAIAADVIVCKIPSLPEKQIELGTVRNRLVEPLFKGIEAGGDTVWEAMGRAVEHTSLDWETRMAVWSAVGVVGDMAKIRSLPSALTTYLSPFLVSSSEIPSEVQPSKVRLLSIPEYFFKYKQSATDVAPFLGGCIAAKTLLADSGLSISKIQYNSMGPAAIYTVKEDPK